MEYKDYRASLGPVVRQTPVWMKGPKAPFVPANWPDSFLAWYKHWKGRSWWEENIEGAFSQRPRAFHCLTFFIGLVPGLRFGDFRPELVLISN